MHKNIMHNIILRFKQQVLQDIHGARQGECWKDIIKCLLEQKNQIYKIRTTSRFILVYCHYIYVIRPGYRD